jgi:hypothetical protein
MIVVAMPKTDNAQIANTISSSRVRRMWGLDLRGWETAMLISLGLAAIAAFAVVLATAIVVRLQHIEAEEAKKELEEYKSEAAQKIAEANSEAAKAKESAAKLNNETTRVQADNLALQTVLLPRRAGLFGIDRSPPAAEWFAGIAPHAGTTLLIQHANDKEAANLAAEIGIIATKFGWTAQFVDDERTHLNPDQIRDGVSVSYPAGRPWTTETQNEPWFAWSRAAEAMADALTNAGLAVGDRPVSRFGFSNDSPRGMLQMLQLEPNFDPPLEGVFLQVGARPVAETVQWVKQGRPDMLGNKPSSTPAPEAHK